MQILVPTDFSPTAEKALQYALAIAAKHDGVVYLYHIYTSIESPLIETVEVRREYNIEQERNLMRDLHDLRSKWQPLFKQVKIVAMLGRSPLVGSIISFSKDKGIDLVVMGTQGASGLKKVIVGTIAARIIEKSVCPVLLVPERFEFAEPQKIVFATDCRDEDIGSLAVIGKIAERFQSSVEILHLLDTEKDTGILLQSFSAYSGQLKQAYPEVKFADSIIATFSIMDTLENLHQHIPYDLLVMVRHKRKSLQRLYMQSATRHMAYLTVKPLLVIPDNKEPQ